jgi:hypothetical protein
MLKHYSHIGMEAKRRAVQSLVPKAAATANPAEVGAPDGEIKKIPGSAAKESTKVALIN